jgi:aminoglycoside phosphotransferase family enzyme/predicted kinase
VIVSDSLETDLLEQGLELRETHISLVFLAKDAVYKVKKPVDLGFLDFSTLPLRKQFCEAEVALNRRLAPGVYLGVLPIGLDATGTHRLGASGEPVEWAVHMRRLADEDAADRRLAESRLGRGDVQALAEHLVGFHASARCDPETARFGSVDAIEQNVRENFEQTRASATRHLAAAELGAIERWQLGFLREHRALFEARVAQARVRDGHGDLRLEHCYLGANGTVEIIDCIEFNERFRYGDVCADLAFLAMDLSWHERADLSEALLAAYARAAGDYDLYGVVDFYESYRAYVRGKVSSLLEDDAGASPAARARAAAQARKYYLLAEACTREPLARPALYAVGGGIASGKSTIAETLGELISAPVVDADRTRKQLAGVGATTPLSDAAFAGHYAPEQSERVYAELLRRAEVVLRSKRPVVVEASFRDRQQRLLVRGLAERLGVPFLFVECTAPPDVCRQRLAERAKGPSVSDGRSAIFDAFLASWQPVEELPADSHLQLDTTGPLPQTLERLAARVR